MEEYYRNTYSSSEEHKPDRRSAVGIIIDMVMLVVTLCVVSAFVLTLVIPSINPEVSEMLSTIGLVASFIYAAQLLLTLYWIVRWRRVMMFFMVVLSVVGFFHLSLFYKVEYRRSYGDPKFERSAVKILTYNTRSFIDDNGDRRLDSVAAIIKRLNPDIVCFQEMGFGDLADSLLKPLNPLPQSLSRAALSPYIYTRYPVIRAERIDTMMNFVWADLVINDDTVRIFNNHMHTTAIRRDDNSYIENHEFLDDEVGGKLHDMIERLSANNKIRAVQADTISQIIAASPYPVIVCGDFNDTPVSYTYHTVSDGLNDVFRKVGRGFSHTYRGFFNMLRIDYVLCSDEFEPLSYGVMDSVSYSDHFPVFVRLRYNGPLN